MMFRLSSKGTVIISGTSHPELANQVATEVNLECGESSIYHKPNRETVVEIAANVRGRDVFIIQTGTSTVNNDIMELLLTTHYCRQASARTVNIVMPYLPYSKQTKMHKRGCIVSRLIAAMLCRSGMDRLITVDLNSKEIQGFFDMPIENLRASPFLISHLTSIICGVDAVIVARNPNVVPRATSFAERLCLPIAVVHGAKVPDYEVTDGRHSPPPVAETAGLSRSIHLGMEFIPLSSAKAKPPLNIVGDVQGKVAVIVDNMIDEIDHFIDVADVVIAGGASKVYVVGTHGLFLCQGEEVISRLESSKIDHVIVTNSVPIKASNCPKIEVIDISVLLSEAIRRTQNNESMSYLFRDVPVDD